MRLSSVLVLGFQLSSVIALPTQQAQNGNVVLNGIDIAALLEAAGQQQQGGGNGAGAGAGAGNGAEKGTPAATSAVASAIPTPPLMPFPAAPAAPVASAAPPAAPPAEGEKKEEEEAKLPGELELAGVFGTATALGGADIKQDVVFTKGAIGAFEYEFQGPTADSLTVTENTTPAAPPAGFQAIEPNSFKVALATSKGAGLTLSKIDYIFDNANPALAAVDLTKAQVGKLCTDTNTFTIDAALGELEFEVEENEVTLNLNKAVTAEGEWGIFVPVAAAAGNATAPAAPPAAAPVKAEKPAGGKNGGAGAGAGGKMGAGAGAGGKMEAGGKKTAHARAARRSARRA